MSRWVKTRLWHLREIAVRDGEPYDEESITNDLSRAKTLLDDNEKPVAAIGLVSTYDGVADVWTALSQEAIDHHLLSVVRACKKHLNEIMSSEGREFRRLQSYCMPDLRHLRWMSMFDFEYEGTLRRASPDGSDMCVCGRIATWVQ